jgi:hypothetical protein
MSELVAGLSPDVAIAGKRRAAELGREISVKLAAKKAKDAVK